MANLSNINNKFLVTTGGNVLIGQTTTVGTPIFQVAGNSRFSGEIRTANRLAIKETYFGYSSGYKVIQVGESAATKSISLGYDPSGNTSGSFSGNEILIPNNIRVLAPAANNSGYYGLMMLNSSNKVLLGSSNYLMESNYIMALDPATKNVGIGTDSPDVKLHVYNGDSGATTVGGASDELILENDTDCGLTIRSGTSSDGVISFADSGDHNIGQVYYSHGSNSMTFRTNDNNAVTIDSSGKVIINDNTIGDKLLLAGDDAGTARGLMFNCSTTTNQGDTWDIDAQSSTGIIKFSTTSTERMRIESTGVVKFPNTAAGTGDVGTIAHYTNNYMYMRGGTSGLAIGDDGFGVSIYLNNSNNITFHTGAGTEMMQINNVGNVGIGVVPEGNIVSYIKQLRIGEQTTIQGHSNGVGGTSASWFSTNYIFSVGGATAINTGESMVYQAQQGRHSFHNSESTTAGGVVTLRDAFSIEPNLDLKASTKGPSSAGVGAVYTPPYPLRFNAFNGTGPKFLGVYPLRGGSQFLDIAINTTSDNIMYYAMFRGYFYGRGSRWSWTAGYTYQGSIINVQNHFVLNGNAANLTSYRGAAGSAYPANLCLRMDSGSSGYTEGFGELYMFAHANSLQNGFQVAAFSENNAANPGLWT